MKISSMKKIKPEQYEVLFDNGNTVILYEDVIVNNNLLHKEIDDYLFNVILNENEIAKLEYEGIKFIERKIRSEKEVRDFLFTKTDNEDTINKIINRFQDLKLLDDKVFANAFAKDKYNISKWGIDKIISGLEENNIEDNLIINAVSFITNEDQLIRIKKIVDRYVIANKKDSYIKLKNKMYSNLIEKGYPKELIYEVINDIDFNTDEIIKKQYDILYKKHSSRYNSDELMKKMITFDLKAKGFNYEDIKKLGL